MTIIYYLLKMVMFILYYLYSNITALIQPEHRDWQDINHLADKPSFLSYAVVSNLHTLIWIKPARYHADTAPGSAF